MTETTSDLCPNHAELLQLMTDFGSIGRGPNGGMNRLAAGTEDGRARDRFRNWICENGGEMRFDRIGNMFGVFDLGAEFGDKALYCGSHLDTQPNGGRFDGTYGVLAAAIAMREMVRRVKKRAFCPMYRYLVVCNWTNEEGVRFQPSLLGSSAFAGLLDYSVAISATDANGVSIDAALCEIGYRGSESGIPKPDRYFEIHVELGRILENSGRQIGVVTHCWGVLKLCVCFDGEAAHTGPTPMVERKDALFAASLLIAAVNKRARQPSCRLHGAVGRMEVTPNSPNVVPSQTRLWVDLRSDNESDLKEAETWLRAKLCEIDEVTGCRGRIVTCERRPVQVFDKRSIALSERALDRVGLSRERLATVAGHDAVALQKMCPATLLFIPSVNGAAHSPDELSRDQDLINGLTGLTAVLEDVVRQPTSVEKNGA